jgi:hypothetical protein
MLPDWKITSSTKTMVLDVLTGDIVTLIVDTPNVVDVATPYWTDLILPRLGDLSSSIKRKSWRMNMDKKTGQEGYVYAQLNGDDIAIGISYLAGEVTKDNMIDITAYEGGDHNKLLGMRYSRDGGTWGPGPETGEPPDGEVQAIIADAQGALGRVQAVLPDLMQYEGKAAAFDTAVPAIIAQGVRVAGGDMAKARQVVAAVAAAAPMIGARVWSTGMVTGPGELVYGPNRDYLYMYSGKDAYTHSNAEYYPGSPGVYYWAIVPAMHGGERVFPDRAGIVVFVENGSIWWDTEITQLYRWTGPDFDCPSVYYPGALGVHQWERVG